MKGPTDGELAAYEKTHKGETGAKGYAARLAGELRRTREWARKQLDKVRKEQKERHDVRAQRVEFHPGQLVYRKQMVPGRKLTPKWIGPYRVLRRISDLVYKIQMGPREVNVYVEQVKLCRATREELRERKRQGRRRIREQQFRKESENESDTDSSESEEADYWTQPGCEQHDSRPASDEICRHSRNAAGEEEGERTIEGDSNSVLGPPMSCATDAGEINGRQHDYALRPRVRKNYRE
jgi:hypothetical protein